LALLAEPPENSVRGLITEVSRSAEVVLVEEDPSDESGSAKGQFAVTGETEILEQQGGDLAPVCHLRRARRPVVPHSGGRRQDRHPGWGQDRNPSPTRAALC